ncbi:hypothetical protein ACVW1B_003656 [Bradyrhizobium sp. USDA 4502]
MSPTQTGCYSLSVGKAPMLSLPTCVSHTLGSSLAGFASFESSIGGCKNIEYRGRQSLILGNMPIQCRSSPPGSTGAVQTQCKVSFAKASSVVYVAEAWMAWRRRHHFGGGVRDSDADVARRASAASEGDACRIALLRRDPGGSSPYHHLASLQTAMRSTPKTTFRAQLLEGVEQQPVLPTRQNKFDRLGNLGNPLGALRYVACCGAKKD